MTPLGQVVVLTLFILVVCWVCWELHKQPAIEEDPCYRGLHSVTRLPRPGEEVSCVWCGEVLVPGAEAEVA